MTYRHSASTHGNPHLCTSHCFPPPVFSCSPHVDTPATNPDSSFSLTTYAVQQEILPTNVYNSHSFPPFTLGLTRDQMALCLGAQTPEPQCLDLNPSFPTYQLCDLNFIAP